jgi:hypothetical protein
MRGGLLRKRRINLGLPENKRLSLGAVGFRCRLGLICSFGDRNWKTMYVQEMRSPSEQVQEMLMSQGGTVMCRISFSQSQIYTKTLFYNLFSRYIVCHLQISTLQCSP